MRARRVVGWVFGGLGALVLLVLVAVAVALSSETVGRRLIAEALARSAADIRIGTVSGPLRGPLVLTDVGFRNEALAAEVDSVLVDWAPLALIERRVRLERLHATGVRVVLADSAPEEPDTAPKRRPSLPVDVVLGDVLVRGISVAAGDSLVLRRGEARVGGRAEDYRLLLRGEALTPVVAVPSLEVRGRGNLERMTLDHASAGVLDGRVVVVGRVGWWPQVQWDVRLSGTGIRPGLLLTDPGAWPGAVAFRGITAGVLDSTGPSGRVIIDSIGGALRGQPLYGNAAVRLRGGNYEIPSLDLGWGSAELTGSGRVGETLDLEYRLAVRDLGTAVPNGAGSLAASGRVEGSRTRPSVTASVEGRGLAYAGQRVGRLTGDVAADLRPGGRVETDLRGIGAVVASRPLDSLVLAVRGTRERHRATAHAFASEADTGATTKLRLELAGGLAGGSWRGLVAALEANSTRAGDWRLERPARLAAGSGSAALERLCLRSEDDARACAEVAWRGARGWRVTSSLERLPLDLANPYLAGQTLEGRLDGTIEAAATRTRLDADVRLASRGATLRFVPAGDSVPRRVTLDSATAVVRGGAEGLRGTLGVGLADSTGSRIGVVGARFALPEYTRLGLPLARQAVEGTMEARFDDLSLAAAFAPQVDTLAGRGVLDLALSGSVAAPRLEGVARVENVRARLQGHRAIAGAVEARLDWTVAPDSTLAGDLTVVPTGVRYEYALDREPRWLAVDSGSVRLHAGPGGLQGTVNLALADTTGVGVASLRGSLELPEYTRLGENLRSQPLALQLDVRAPDLSFAAPMVPQADSLRGRLALDLDVSGSVAAPRVRGAMRADRVTAWLTGARRLDGSLEGNLSASLAEDSTLTGEFRVAPRAMVLTYLAGDRPRRMTVDSTALEVRVGNGGMRGRLDFRLSDPAGEPVGVLAGRLTLPEYTRVGAPLDSQPVRAEIDGRVDDLSFLSAFTTQADSLAGRLALDVDVDGTVGAPRYVGGLTLENGGARLPNLGLRLQDARLVVDNQPGGTMAIRGGVRSGGGTLRIEGSSPYRPTPTAPARIRLEGDRFEVSNTAEAHVLVSPALDIFAAGDSLDVRGEVRVPFARIELAEIPETAVPPSDDVILLDSVAAREEQRLMTAEVRVVLGDTVTFKGFNFTAELGGSLLAIEAPDQPTLGSGTVVIEEGRYKAYGQDLSVREGRIRFAGGPIDNPGLDLRASRTTEDSVTVGLAIGGTLKSPEVRVFSDPPMGQNQALAYLILGHPLDPHDTESDNSLVSEALTSLGLSGGNLVAGALGKSLGFEEARLETEGGFTDASLVASRYLSPRFYITYGIGLFDPGTSVSFNYLLSPRWTLHGETGTSTQGDIFFRLE